VALLPPAAIALATKAELKLISTLKQYFLVTVSLFAAIGMKSDIALDFLSRLNSEGFALLGLTTGNRELNFFKS
jgi:hypothetical protein